MCLAHQEAVPFLQALSQDTSHSWCKVHAGPNHRLLPYFQQLFSPTWPKTCFPRFLEYTRAVMNKSHIFSLYLHSQITEARSRGPSMHRSPFPWEGDSPGVLALPRAMMEPRATPERKIHLLCSPQSLSRVPKCSRSRCRARGPSSSITPTSPAWWWPPGVPHGHLVSPQEHCSRGPLCKPMSFSFCR